MSAGRPSPLQNRVTPFGEIVAVAERGLFIGNRGIIHDPQTQRLLSRRWATRRWLICLCAFKGRRRDLMSASNWTELFFLDEATALAAGHRPCFECRRRDAEAFRTAWADEGGKRTVEEMDRVLHEERLDGRDKRCHPLAHRWQSLPDGTMIASNGEAYLVTSGESRRWTPGGYRGGIPEGNICLLTPPTTVRALMNGYQPVLHPTAKPE